MTTMNSNRDRMGLDRRGVTFIELLIATLIFGTIMAGALGYMAAQNSAFTRGSERMTVLQNLRYAMETLDTNLETAGTNLATGQSGVVYAGDDVVAFNADYATNIQNDVSAVFREIGATDAEVTALDSTVTIPNSGGHTYGDTLYGGGLSGPAETIVLFLEPDQTTQRGDDFILYRRVNSGSTELVARNLLQVDTIPFFRYEAERNFPSAPPTIVEIPGSDLPLRHFDARADSIRAVRVTLGATNGLSGDPERTAEMSRLIRMPNAGMARQRVCGDEPIFAEDLEAALDTTATGDDAVNLTWDPSVDDGGGEEDVIRYVLWRRLSGSTDWGAPFLSIPSGQTSYLYQDADVESATTYEYAVGAQDCTPSLSGTSVSDPVTLP